MKCASSVNNTRRNQSSASAKLPAEYRETFFRARTLRLAAVHGISAQKEITKSHRLATAIRYVDRFAIGSPDLEPIFSNGGFLAIYPAEVSPKFGSQRRLAVIRNNVSTATVRPATGICRRIGNKTSTLRTS